MKARILQLAIEAGMYVDLNGSPWPKWMGSEECEKAYEKFAELIVEDCAEVGSQGLGATDRLHTAKRIREHFEVASPKTWVKLTEAEIGELYRMGWSNNMDFARAIEFALEKKNGH